MKFLVAYFVRLKHMGSDFTGTLSMDEVLLSSLKELLKIVALIVKLHVITGDIIDKAWSHFRKWNVFYRSFWRTHIRDSGRSVSLPLVTAVMTGRCSQRPG